MVASATAEYDMVQGMPKAYSLDLRVRVLDYYDLGHSYEETAEVFKVSESFVKSMVKQREREGTVEIKPHGGGNQPAFKTAEQKAMLLNLSEQHPDLTLKELAQKVAEAGGPKVDHTTVGRTLRSLGVSRKKNTPSGRAGHAGGSGSTGGVPPGSSKRRAR